MKTWLKGGLIGTGIGLVLFLLLKIIAPIICDINQGFGALCRIGSYILILPGSLIARIMGRFLLMGSRTALPVLTIFCQIILYFIIGAVIGLIISRIRQKKST